METLKSIKLNDVYLAENNEIMVEFYIWDIHEDLEIITKPLKALIRDLEDIFKHGR